MRGLFPILVCFLLGSAAVAQGDPGATGALSLSVRDRDGKPLAGVWLTLQPSGRVTMTDGQGAANLRGLPPGTYLVSLAPAGYRPLALPVTLAANVQTIFALTLYRSGGAAPVRPPTEYLVTPPVPPGSGPVWRAAQETVLREATFRYLFSIFPQPQRFPVYYLSVQGYPWGQGREGSKDPDAALLRRFRGSTPPVREVSALSASSKDWQDQGRHHWIIFRVTSIHWTSDTSVEINAGAAQAGYLSSDNYLLTCILRNGWWQITGITELSI